MANKGLDLSSEGAESSAGDKPAAASKSLEAAATAAAESEDGQAIALVVDSEVTSYLMMGALSPGLKRHSVTLFEGISEHRSTPLWQSRIPPSYPEAIAACLYFNGTCARQQAYS